MLLVGVNAGYQLFHTWRNIVATAGISYMAGFAQP